MEKNEILTIDITDLGENGEGIGRYEGMAIFVPGALPGEKITARIRNQKKNYAHGRLLRSWSQAPSGWHPPVRLPASAAAARSSR